MQSSSRGVIAEINLFVIKPQRRIHRARDNKVGQGFPALDTALKLITCKLESNPRWHVSEEPNFIETTRGFIMGWRKHLTAFIQVLASFTHPIIPLPTM